MISRPDEEKDQLSELEDKVERNTQVEQQNAKRLNKYEDSLGELQVSQKGKKKTKG